jgi:hypothetical protein
LQHPLSRGHLAVVGFDAADSFITNGVSRGELDDGLKARAQGAMQQSFLQCADAQDEFAGGAILARRVRFSRGSPAARHDMRNGHAACLRAGHAETEFRVGKGEQVAIGEERLGDLLAIDERAVGAAKIFDTVMLAIAADDGMFAGDARRRDLIVAGFVASQCERKLGDDDRLAAGAADAFQVRRDLRFR